MGKNKNPYQVLTGMNIGEEHIGKYISFEFYIGDDWPIKVDGILESTDCFFDPDNGVTLNYVSVIENPDELRSSGGFNVHNPSQEILVHDKIPQKYDLIVRRLANKRRKTLKRKEGKARKAALRAAAIQAVASNS